MTQTSHQPIRWSSRIAFITAATGAAIGLGNIWKFPYLVGENGGGAFVLVYLLCVLGVGLPLLIAETLLGRMGRSNPVRSMKELANRYRSTPAWSWVGWLGVLAGFLILSYYSVIAGWSMAYLFKMAGGFLSGMTPAQAQATFAELQTSADVQVIWHSLFMTLTAVIVARGLADGIESVTRLMIPCLLIILLLLDFYGATTSGFGQSLEFLLKPDFSKLTGESVLVALGQAFFSLGLANGSTMVYGSYLPDDVSVTKTTAWVALADTLAAMMAGFAIFAVVFANNMSPSMGPGLIFETLPIAFSQMPLGGFFGTIFFVLVFFAAITSAVALIEPAISLLSENYGFSRAKASAIASGSCWLIGLGTIGAFRGSFEFSLGGMNFFECIDYLTANLMLPIGGILIAIFAGWVIPQEERDAQLDLGAHAKSWSLLVRYVAPAAVLWILLEATGIL
jgi:NSS family neurotransmitter:Na+ symporter